MKRQFLVKMLALFMVSIGTNERLWSMMKMAEDVVAKTDGSISESVESKMGASGLKIDEDTGKASIQDASKFMASADGKSYLESIGSTSDELSAIGTDTAKLQTHIESKTGESINAAAAHIAPDEATAILSKASSKADKADVNSNAALQVRTLKRQSEDASIEKMPTATAEQRAAKASAKDAMRKDREAEDAAIFKTSFAGKHSMVNSMIPRTIKGVSTSFGNAGHRAMDTLMMAVLFMIPGLFQSAFLAQEQRNALLATYAAPVQFGNITLQMPDSVINLDDPTLCDFIYYGIPVDSAHAKLSAGAASMYPGVHGPDKNNKITAGIHSSLTKAFSMGAASNPAPARYDLDASALSSLPLFVSYSDKSWATWGTASILDPTFPDMMINLNTGYVFFADGLPDGLPAAGLVGTGATQSVATYLSSKLGQLSTSGGASGYVQYSDTFTSEKGAKAASPLTEQFNCACITDSPGGVISGDTMKTCGTSCLLTSALNSLSAGIIINADGKQLQKGQDLAAEVAKGALGQVVPIQGLGTKFQDFLAFFPGSTKDAIANSGVLTVSLGFGSESADGSETLSGGTDVKITGADPDNYVAKGVYVYQCKNTEFAKILRSQSGGSATVGNNDHIFDYIVFLDKDLNQVPLMVPVQDPLSYHFPKMGLNPLIEYVSTIMGNSDSQGGFTLLPQLNIQSPAELVAKGLPASFPPLFGLKAKGGSLSINYNQNITSKIGPMEQALEGHAALGQQFKVIKDAMFKLLSNGPFGKYGLKPVDATMTPAIGGVNLVVYTGYNAYPVSHDEKATNCTDVLVPLSPATATAHSKTVVLPSNNVGLYYGLVSDLTYTVNSDGTLVVLDAGFKNSPLSQKTDSATKNIVWTIDHAKKDTYYWLSQLTRMGQASDPHFALPQPLVDMVHSCRKNWIAWIDKTSKSPLSNQEFAGTPWIGTKNVLTIVGQQALSNGLYVYTCNPNPSKSANDFFLLTNSNAPTVSDKTLGTMKASSATAKTNMLSMVSGLLYNASGAQVKNAQGVCYQIDAKSIIQSLYAANPKAFSDEFKSKLNLAYGQFLATENAMVYPFEFYNLKLGMYQADIDRGSYVYFDATGAGTSANFEPSDYFVAVDLDAKPAVWATKLSASTKYMMSLVSGQVYSHAGPQYKLPASQISTIVNSLSPSWRPGLKDKIASLTVKLAATQKNASNETAKMNAGAKSGLAGSITFKQADIVAMIKRIASESYLPLPYKMLKQDPVSKQYIQVSPASVDGTDFMYTFFDVPNSYKDAQGKAVHLGGMFDSKGNLLYPLSDLLLKSTLVQNGISIDTAGRQWLGAANLQPIMMLDNADHNLKPGDTGKSMIYSNHKDFPTIGIQSPVSYQDRQFHFYYNTIMKSYYVMEINGKDVRYVSMAGGDVYNLDGSSRPTMNPVAFVAATAGHTDLTNIFLPYLNSHSYTQAVMMNPLNKNLYSDFVNSEKEFKGSVSFGTDNSKGAFNLFIAGLDPYNQVSVVQMPVPASIPPMPTINVANQYNVYFDAKVPTVYNVDPNYLWQNLMLLPVNMVNGALTSLMPDENYNYARLILKNGSIDRMIFANKLYKIDTIDGQVYTMKSVNDPKGFSLVLSLKVDKNTNVKYAEIVVESIPAVTYNYQYVFDSLSDEQLTSYRYNAWKAETVASVTAKIILVQFLPTTASGDVNVSSIDIKSVKGVSDDQSVQDTISRGLTRIKQDTFEGRFVAVIFKSGGSDDQAPFYDYFDQNGYADLETGALFDDKGVPIGTTLKVQDLLNLLKKFGVLVVRDAQNVATLVSRFAPPAMVQAAANNGTISAASASTKSGGSHEIGTSATGAQNHYRAGVLGRLSSALFGN